MNILVTGCNGQLGSEIRRMAEAFPQHTFYYTDVAELDITCQKAVERFAEEHQIDGIVNCAAYTAVDKAEDNEALCELLNGEAPGYLAAAIENRGGWIIHISTDYVFDGKAHLPYRETDATNPQSVYGRTKLAGEKNVLQLCSRTVIIRTAWLYSSFGNNFVKTMIRLGRERSELGVVFDQIGTPTYARDLASAIFTIIDKGIQPGIYHFTNEGTASWYDFAKAIHRMAGIRTCKVSPIHTADYHTQACRPHYSVLDKTKIKNTFSIEIPYWEESLNTCIQRLLNE